MNTLSIQKLSDLFTINSHRILEIYMYKNNARFITIMCEKYLNIFMIDLKTIPLTFSPTTDKYNVFKLHPTEIQYPSQNIYQYIMDKSYHNELQLKLYQKKRLDDHYKSDKYHPIYFFSDLLLYSGHHFKIENYRHNLNFIMFCISIDDYYLHQNTISVDIHNHYEYFFNNVSKNIEIQEKIITTILKYSIDIHEFRMSLNKYQKYRYTISSIFNRSLEFQNYKHLQPNIIQLIYFIFRSQSDFFFHYENKLYLLFFHISQIRLLLQK